ncbi:MAG: hypothetical protein FIA95_12060 [Gemmatimonadetes bacterium]|nr:hypothetical protein [Gemmatimonadota bacterium]
MEHEMKDPFADEARERWGHTDAYKESARRTKQYKPADWAKIKAEAEAVEAGLAALLRAGEPADGVQAMDLAEEARLHIHRWFYPCPHTMHVGLAEMYTADPRFTAHYDEREPGLAAFVATAIKANAKRAQP